MRPVLREYQLEAVGAVLESWEAGIQRPALQLATGLGKTVIFAEVARIAHRAYGARTCVLVHRDELVRQTVDKLHRADPEMRIGIVQADRGFGIFADVVVASVQTLCRRLGKIRPDHFPYVIVDECHHATAKSYADILDHFGCLDDGGKALGVTATMARGDRRGLGDVWDKVVFERGIAWGVQEGFLVPAEVRTLAVPGLDTDRIGRGADGDLAVGQLGKAMAQAHAGELIADAYLKYARTQTGYLRRAISFAPTIDVAEAWAAAYEAAGARTATITGTTGVAERQAAYADLAAGRIDVLSSVMVLTEGFDLPACEVAIVGRPTKSMPLLTQMVGRVLRPSPATGKTSALLLDVVGALGNGLARSFDLSIPAPDVPEAPEQDPDAVPVRREKAVLAAPKAVEFVARDLLTGEVLKPRKTHSDCVEPSWLRTAGGVAFLPASTSFPWRLICHVRPDGSGPWWRQRVAAGVREEPVPLEAPADWDPTELHPGLPAVWADQHVTDPQRKLCSAKAINPGPNKLTASNAIEVFFASRDLDGWARPRLTPVDPPPGVG